MLKDVSRTWVAGSGLVGDGRGLGPARGNVIQYESRI